MRPAGPPGSELLVLPESKSPNLFYVISLLCLLWSDPTRLLRSRLLELLQDYGSAVDRIPPVLLPLMQPFISRVEAALSPGLTSLSWTSLNTDGCKEGDGSVDR